MRVFQLGLFVLLSIPTNKLLAQIIHANDSAIYKKAFENASSHSLRIQQAINIGSEYNESIYNVKIGEHQFFLSNEPLAGQILYNNVLYKNMLLQYDLITDEIITRHSNGNKIVLIKEKVTEFTLGGYSFQRLSDNNIKSGFYNILVDEGGIKFFARREKQIKGNANNLTFRQEPGHVEEKIKYYLVINGNFYQVKNHKGITKILSEKKRSPVLKETKHQDEEIKMISVVKQYIGSKYEL